MCNRRSIEIIVGHCRPNTENNVCGCRAKDLFLLFVWLQLAASNMNHAADAAAAVDDENGHNDDDDL